jgi:hypothetical protein
MSCVSAAGAVCRSLPAGEAVEIERMVSKDGTVLIAGQPHLVGFAWAGPLITLRLDGHLMHTITDDALVGTLVPGNDRPACPATRGTHPLHPAATGTAGSLRAQRRVHTSGRILVVGQRSKLGPRHRGKLVTVVIEDTHLRTLDGDEEIAVRPCRSLKPITRLHVTGKGVKAQPRSSIS